MKRVAAGAHLPAPWLFQPSKRPDDRTDYCLDTPGLRKVKTRVSHEREMILHDIMAVGAKTTFLLSLSRAIFVSGTCLEVKRSLFFYRIRAVVVGVGVSSPVLSLRK